jgi:4-hydroxymandelate oxidase
MPVLIAPTAFHCLANPEGEVATARAAGAAGTVMILSTLSNSAVEDVTRAASGPVWFQLYVHEDRGLTSHLVNRVLAAGCKAIVLTVDVPVLGRRERDIRNGFGLPAHLSAKNLTGKGLGQLPEGMTGSALAEYINSFIYPGLTWTDVDWLCSISKLPVFLKGLITAEDAVRAVDHGASGIVVSNHGGRQLDTARPTIEALPEIVDAVKGRVEVLIDGGIRRGTDVLKAVAIGAKAVLVGRPVLWGLAVNGERGVVDVLNLLRNEFDAAMALCGCARVDEIRDHLIA